MVRAYKYHSPEKNMNKPLTAMGPTQASKLALTSEILKSRFGAKSENFSKLSPLLNTLWEKVRDDETAKSKIASWREMLERVYGYDPVQDMFVTHTYLASLVKLILYYKLEPSVEISKEKVARILDGNHFISFGIANFVENDFSTWVLNNRIREESLDLFAELAEGLIEYDFSVVDEDLFKEIYEEMVGRGDRHTVGEYYTPEWLSQLILHEVIRRWQQKEERLPRILDPACGSGTFLCNAIRLLKSMTPNISLETILDRVVGIEINPLATMIAKANYIIALGDLVRKGVNIRIPIINADALNIPHDRLGQFDIIVGNPPWIVMRSIKNPSYQEDLKREVLKYGLLNKGDVHLFTQMEMATLFFMKTSDLYLSDRGIIGFVMPRSVIAGTIQHIGFRRFAVPRMKLLKIIDLEDVQPLFNMPSCVLIATKGSSTRYPVTAQKLSGLLPKRNAKLAQIETLLSSSSYSYSPPEFPVEHSYYFTKFRVGASIFPRAFYFVDIISGANGRLAVKSSREILEMVKPPWKIELKGEVEPEFLYATVLAWEIIPFGYLRLRPIILPATPLAQGYVLYGPEELESAGFLGVASWFKRCEEIWKERRTEKSSKRFPTLKDRLNYNGLLSVQNPSKRFVVLFNSTGTNIVSCVLDKRSLPSFMASGIEIKPVGFVTDVKSWFYETNSVKEAHYICAVLNSMIINARIKPLQPRGLFGARAIHRRPFLFPIPKFEPQQRMHVELAEISAACHERVGKMLSARNNVRNHIRKALAKEVSRIDELVGKLMEGK